MDAMEETTDVELWANRIADFLISMRLTYAIVLCSILNIARVRIEAKAHRKPFWEHLSERHQRTVVGSELRFWTSPILLSGVIVLGALVVAGFDFSHFWVCTCLIIAGAADLIDWIGHLIFQSPFSGVTFPQKIPRAQDLGLVDSEVVGLRYHLTCGITTWVFSYFWCSSETLVQQASGKLSGWGWALDCRALPTTCRLVCTTHRKSQECKKQCAGSTLWFLSRYSTWLPFRGVSTRHLWSKLRCLPCCVPRCSLAMPTPRCMRIASGFALIALSTMPLRQKPIPPEPYV